MVKQKAIFLDRDGVINNNIIESGKPYPPLKLGSVHVIKGMKELIKKWQDEKYLVIVITNQPDVAAHLVTKNKVDKINKFLKNELNFDDIFVCYHGEKDNCNCRKPKIGLFLQAQEKYNIDMKKSWMIGDRWKDIEAGKKAGCKTIYLNYGYDEQRPTEQDYTIYPPNDTKAIGDCIK